MKTKEEAIAMILANDTYTPDSGLILRLTKCLSKMSLSDLSNLNLILMCRNGESLKAWGDVARSQVSK